VADRNIALNDEQLFFLGRVVKELRDAAGAHATYQARVAATLAQRDALLALANAYATRLGVDPAAEDFEVNETARTLVVTTKRAP
jgi:hypothetical protein